MTAPGRLNGFAARPRDVDAWIKAPEPSALSRNPRDLFTARLTVDATQSLRGRIKVAAIQRGLTVAAMLRGLLEDRVPGTAGNAP